MNSLGPPECHRDDRDTPGHRLQENDPEGLGVGRVDQDVHLSDIGSSVWHLAGHRDGTGEAQSADERRQRIGILRGQAVGVTPDDDRVHRMSAFAQERLCAEQSILALPRLQTPYDTDHRNVRGKLEGACSESVRGTRAPAATTNVGRAGNDRA